jgi:glyoxylate/hydroxypyruvate reductase A
MPGETLEGLARYRRSLRASTSRSSRSRRASVLAAVPSLQLIASLWAGVDGLLADPSWPRSVPLTRLIEPQADRGDGRVGRDARAVGAPDGAALPRAAVRAEWIQHEQPTAGERTVAILGFGELGGRAAEALLAVRVRPGGLEPRAAGPIRASPSSTALRGSTACLRRRGIVVCLLPATVGDARRVDAPPLAQCAARATLIKSGRGAVIDDERCSPRSDSGRSRRRSSMCTTAEPLPAAHRLLGATSACGCFRTWRRDRSRVGAADRRRHGAALSRRRPLPELVDVARGLLRRRVAEALAARACIAGDASAYQYRIAARRTRLARSSRDTRARRIADHPLLRNRAVGERLDVAGCRSRSPTGRSESRRLHQFDQPLRDDLAGIVRRRAAHVGAEALGAVQDAGPGHAQAVKRYTDGALSTTLIPCGTIGSSRG